MSGLRDRYGAGRPTGGTTSTREPDAGRARGETGPALMGHSWSTRIALRPQYEGTRTSRLQLVDSVSVESFSVPGSTATGRGSV